MGIVIQSIHAHALSNYAVDSNKDVGFGVKIRMQKIFDYDEKDAFKWAFDHKLALKLDASAFKKQAELQNIECVNIIEKPSVTIPRKIEVD